MIGLSSARGKGPAPKGAPLSRVRSRWLLVAALAVSAGMTFVSLRSFPALPLQNDSVSYYEVSLYLRGAGENPSLFYPPGYPAFLAALFAGPAGYAGRSLLIVQHALRFVPLGLFCAMAQLTPGSYLPGLAALLFALAPENYVFGHFMMSESLALGLGGLCLLLLTWLWVKPGASRSAAAGMAIGLLTLVRPAGAVLLLAALVPRSMLGRRRTSLRLFLVASAAWMAAIAPWLVHNAAVSGAPSLTNSVGRHLFNRVVAEDGFRPEGNLPEFPEGPGKAPPPSYWWNYLPVLMRLGYSESQADAIFLRVAVDGIASNPFRYAVGTVEGAAEMLFWDPVPPSGASPYRKLEYELGILRTPEQAAAFWQRRIPSSRALGSILAELRPTFGRGPEGDWLAAWSGMWQRAIALLKPALILLFAAGVAWAVFGGNPLGMLASIAVVPGLLAHSAMEMAVPRYGLPYQPLVLYLTLAGAPGLIFLKSLIVRKRSRKRKSRKN